MDDERLIARLRAARSLGEPRPGFVEELHADLAIRLGLQQLDPTTARPFRLSRLLLLAATIALLLALGAGAVLVGSALHLIKLPTSTLDDIRDAGAVRVAVRPDAPQVMSSAGSLDGFDVEVARLMADGFGVQAHLVPVSTATMLGDTTGTWQVGMPSTRLTPDDLTRFAVSDPYYAWPVYLVALRSSSATDPADLANGPLCAVSDSAAELWLTGNSSAALNVAQAPPAAALQLLADDTACLDELRRGDATAIASSQLLPPDVASSDDLRMVGDGPVAFEQRVMIVPRTVTGEDELVAELNRVIRQARADGTLADLSRTMFGGEDLTVGLQ